MHYYKRNLGDYAKKAGRLTMLQHGAYTLLIDSCYDREQFPTLEEAIEWTWASSSAEIEAVEFVLRKFFVLIDGVYVQNRIEEEIADYQSKSDTNKRIAIERETKRKEKRTNRAQDVNDSTTKRHLTKNQEPLTTNQEPKTKNQEDTISGEIVLVGDSDESPTTKTKIIKFTPDDRDLAARMLASIRLVAPSVKGAPNWPDKIRLMREIDGHTLDEIWQMFEWANRDDFWRTNILSPMKLREKWPQLEAKRNNPSKTNGSKGTVTDHNMAEISKWLARDEA